MHKEIMNKLLPLTIALFVFSLALAMIIFAWTGPSQSPPGGNPIHYCSTQADITAALADIGTGAGTIVLKPGTINLTGTININGGGSYIIEGQGDNTVIDCNGDRTAFSITSAASCILKDFKIDAQDLTTSDRIIINVNGVDNVILDTIKIVGHSTYWNGRGIWIENSDNTYISNCKLNYLVRGIYLNNANESNIINNKISETQGPMTAMFIYNSSYNTIAHNIINSSAPYGIGVESISYNTISNNIIYNSGVGLDVNGGTNNVISGNKFYNNNSDGIQLTYGSDNNSIEGNTCFNNDNGIRLYSSNNNTITGNTCNNNILSGISLSWSSNNSVSGNTCDNNISNTSYNTAGIHILNDSDGNTISGNTCNSNTNTGSGTGYGIYIENSNCDENSVTGNSIHNNESNYNDFGTNTFDTTATDGDSLNNF